MPKLKSPEAALASIAKNGDVFDADLRRNKKIVRPSSMLVPFGATMPYAMTYEPLVRSELMLAGAPVAAAGIAIGAIGRTLSRKRAVKRADADQESIRDEMDEVVDVIRDEDGQLVLRWYGLDNVPLEEVSSSQMIARAKRVAKFADQHDIATITIAAEELGLDGTVSGPTYVTDKKRSAWTELRDNIVEQQVKELAPAELVPLLERTSSNQDVSLRTALMAAVNDPHLIRLSELYDKDPEFIAQKMRQAVRLIIERESDEMEITRESIEGGGFVTSRKAIQRRLHGDSVASSGVSRHPFSGAEQIEYRMEGSLARLAGYPDVEALMRHITSAQDLSNIPRNEALIALYTLLADEKSYTSVSAPRNSHPETDGHATLYARLPFSRRSGETDQHQTPKRRALRYMGVSALVGVSLAAGVIAGIISRDLAYDANDREDARYTEWVVDNDLLREFEEEDSINVYEDEKDTKRYERFLKEHDDVANRTDRAAFAAYERLTDTEDEIAYRSAKLLIESLDLEKMSPYVAGYDFELRRDWLESLGSRLDTMGVPPDMYTMDSDTQFFGDVPSKDNKEIYSVRSLTGESTQGYWYTSVSGMLAIDPRSPDAQPFGGMSLTMQEDAPSNSKLGYEYDYDKVEADFEVETPYIGYEGSLDEFAVSNDIRKVNLPTKSGYEIVAIQIADRANPGVFVPVNHYFSRSLPGIAILEQTFLDARMQDPVLQYKLKKSDDHTIKARRQLNRNGLRVDRDYYPGPTDFERVAVAANVKADLGLDDSAGPDEILEAIRDSKEYSYTPFARENVEPVRFPDDVNHYQMMIDVGEVLAKLDTMNCNIATLEYLLANFDSTKPLAMGAGFNNDGDGSLSQQEAHAWVVNGNGKIIDPTPTVMAAGEVRRESEPEKAEPGSNDENTDMKLTTALGASVTLTALLTVVAWRRRRQLGAVSDAVRTKTSLSSESMQQEIRAVEHDLFAHQGSVALPKAAHVADVASAMERYVRNIPAGVSAPADDVLGRLRRTYIRMNDAAIRRHHERTTDS